MSARSNLVATLLATNGVAPVSPNHAQTYGVLAPSGFPVGRAFTFTASGTNGRHDQPHAPASGRHQYLSSRQLYLHPAEHQAFANTNTILIPDPAAPNPPYPPESGPAKPYPSVINVSNFIGVLGKVTVTLSNLNHSYPSDVNVLLVAPGGAKTLVMSHAGNQDQSTADLNLTFDDSAPMVRCPPRVSLLRACGSRRPTAPLPNLGGFPTNAPAGTLPDSALRSQRRQSQWLLVALRVRRLRRRCRRHFQRLEPRAHQHHPGQPARRPRFDRRRRAEPGPGWAGL